jgi:DNA-binding NtrC family response regulator
MKENRVLFISNDNNITAKFDSIFKNLNLDIRVSRGEFSALEFLALNKYKLVLLDMDLPLLDPPYLLKRIRNIDNNLKVVIIKGKDNSFLNDIDEDVSVLLSKDDGETEIRTCLENILGLSSEKEDKEKKSALSEIMGTSNHIKELLKTIERIKDSDVTVLIQGESGTGKELVSRAIHYTGRKKKNPFVSVSCAAIPENLLESELFGHEKGAFTGALNRVIGKFEQAHGGTLFLDEIGEMSTGIQTKLLRVLERKEFERIGGRKLLKVEVRIIAATNKNLKAQVEKGFFREDLYYRLNVFPVYLSPLRERKEDIPPLVEHFIEKANEKFNKNIRHLSQRAMEAIMLYNWRGNARELDNVISRAVVLSDGNTLLPQHLPEVMKKRPKNSSMPLSSISRMEEEVISGVIDATNGNISLAAKKLGIGRTTLYRKLKKYGINILTARIG